jgi:hypothetical protein
MPNNSMAPPPFVGSDGYYVFPSDTCTLAPGQIDPDPASNPWCPQFDWSQFRNPGNVNLGIGYLYQEPFYQAKGINPQTSLPEIWQLDSYGIPYARWNTQTNTWDNFKDIWQPGFVLPPQGQWQPPISPAEAQAGINQLTTDLFTTFTEYLRWGDEPQILSLVVDFKKNLSSDLYSQLYNFLQLFPRQSLRDWFDANIVPNLPFDMIYQMGVGGIAVDQNGNPILQAGSAGYVAPPQTVAAVPPQDWEAFGIRGAFEANRKSCDPFIWAGFINVFNQANLDYCNKHQIAPWDWEDQKARLYLTAQNQNQMQQLQASFDAYRSTIFGSNPRAQDLINQYAALPKLGDLGLEVSRQAVFKKLLEEGEFDTAESIIVAYTQAQSTVLDAGLKSKIPVNVVTSSGRQVFATPSNEVTPQ